MKTPFRFASTSSLIALLCLSPLTALAQAPAAPGQPPAPPEVPSATTAPAAVEPAAASADPSSAAQMPADTATGGAADAATAPVPSTQEALQAVEGKVDGIQETLAATTATVDKLNKLKVSGYLQSRYEWHDDAAFGVDANNKPLGTNRFYVRRGRLKTLYATANAEYMLQIDATGEGVVVKDAEATVIDTWTPFGLRLTMGQFKIPFGYEVLQSSGDREMPERSLVIRKLFPGERDRGARLQGRYEWLRFSGAIINGGNFTQDAIYGAYDQTSFKDLAGRLGADLGFLTAGASVHWGHALKTTLGKAASGTTAAVPATYANYNRLRLGVDAQLYVDVPELGGLAIKSEVILATDKNIEFSGSTPNKCLNTTALGWYVTVVQNIGENLGVVARLDRYDPSSSVESGCVTATAGIPLATEIDRVTTMGGGLLMYFSGNVKGTLVYEHLSEQGTNAKDNDVFTAQLQAKF